MRGLIAVTVLVSLASTGAGWAATDCSALLNQGYVCAVPIAPGQPIGELSKLGAGLQNAGTGGFTPVTRDLNVGDLFTVGSDGSTFVTAGPECQSRKLPANSTVSVVQIDGCAAVKVENNPAVLANHGGTGMAVAGATVAAGVVAGVVLSNQASP